MEQMVRSPAQIRRDCVSACADGDLSVEGSRDGVGHEMNGQVATCPQKHQVEWPHLSVQVAAQKERLPCRGKPPLYSCGSIISRQRTPFFRYGGEWRFLREAPAFMRGESSRYCCGREQLVQSLTPNSIGATHAAMRQSQCFESTYLDPTAHACVVNSKLTRNL